MVEHSIIYWIVFCTYIVFFLFVERLELFVLIDFGEDAFVVKNLK